MSDDDLRLNSLERFRKQSPDLVLEQHSSCEVPAGCIGVVLRWARRGEQRAPATVMHVTDGPARVWLDGEALTNSRVWLGPGAHAWCFELLAPLAPGILQATLSWARGEVVARTGEGAWWATSAPAEGPEWLAPGFDPVGWQALVEAPLPSGERDEETYVRLRLAQAGARPLGLPERRASGGPVRIRHELVIPEERVGPRLSP